MRKTWAGILAVLMIGCAGDAPVPVFDGATGAADASGGDGDGDGDGEVYKSGTRLRAVKYVSDDGAEQFIRWRDTALGIDCYFWELGGTVRCLPAPTISAFYFSDPSCTVPVAYRPTPTCSTPVPGYSTSYEYGACGLAMAAYHETGAKITPALVYYFDSAGACMESATNLDAYEYYSVGPALDPTIFQGATEQVD